MGDLRDALKKAGLIPEADTRPKQREERPPRRNRPAAAEGPREPREPRKRQRSRPPRPPQGARQQDRLVPSRRDQLPANEQDAARARSLLAGAFVTKETRGTRRFHYVDLDGRVPYLMVNPEVARALEVGDLAIAHDGQGAGLVPLDVAKQVLGLSPNLVLFLTRE